MPCGERHCHRGRLVVCCCCFSPSKLVLSAAPSLLSMNLGHDIVVWQSRPTRATTLWQASCGTVAKADLVATKAKTVCGQARKYEVWCFETSFSALKLLAPLKLVPDRHPARRHLSTSSSSTEHASIYQLTRSHGMVNLPPCCVGPRRERAPMRDDRPHGSEI